MLQANTILQNRYHILRELGHGGMGTVYEALDQRLKCSVALKETLVTDNADVRKAFEREAALLANLRHPALPKVIDYFSEGGSDFLVMEFIPGCDLAELLDLNDSPFPESQIVHWALDILGVVEYLHTQDPPILHRDIKPSNLKLTKQGDLFLLDFGIGKGSAGSMSSLATNRSVRAYTPVYASLEQVLGLGTDARSDIYSVGATLYHLLTATAPIDAPTRFQAIEDEHRDPLESIQKSNPDRSPNIASVVHAAMGLSRKNRFSSAGAMRSALLAAIEQNDRKKQEEADGTREIEGAHLSESTIVRTINAVESEKLRERSTPQIETLRVPPPERFSLDQLFPQSEADESLSAEKPSDEDEWRCSNCQGMIDEADASCPHCGSDTLEVVEEPKNHNGHAEAPSKSFTADEMIKIIPQLGYYFRGQNKYDKRDFDGAIADYNKAIELDPTHAACYVNRALAWSSKREHDAAIADYNKAIEIAPDYADAYINRSLARSSKGDAEEAIADCNRAIEIDPQNGRAYAVRGMAQYDKGDLSEAIIDLSKAIEIDPSLAVAYASRGAAKLRQGEDGEAEGDFEIARKLDGSITEWLEQWVNDLKRGRKPGWAERLFQRVTNSRRSSN